MGGSSLAPEVITRTYGVELTVLDATDPEQVRAALDDRLEQTALVISSKSGSTVETDSQKRVYEKAFRDAGIDPLKRIIIVTDPASPLDTAARVAGYRVFNADPTVGGRYSALTAFGLVPSGLAGVDIRQLLEEAQAVELELALDVRENPGLILGAAIAGNAVEGSSPLKDKLGIVADGTHIVGFGDWVEQLVAESTGKQGRGLLPVVLDTDSPELELGLPDLQIVRLVANERETREVREGEIEVSGSLGGQFLVWEYADRGRRTPARHQPVRSARRRVGQDRHARPARRPPRARRAALRRDEGGGSTCGRAAAGSSTTTPSPAPCVCCSRRSPPTATSRCRPTSTGSPIPRPPSSATRSRLARAVR